jgi:hypothetical protein
MQSCNRTVFKFYRNICELIMIVQKIASFDELLPPPIYHHHGKNGVLLIFKFPQM